jgi:8-oxo-dGTP pyrophosphatase MutT (NUDIX family)
VSPHAAWTPDAQLLASARATLLDYRPDDEQQRRLRDEFLSVMAAGAAGPASTMTRDGRPDHLTASCVVLTVDGAGVLLDLHRKVGRWLQFGGHLEPADESLADAGLREATEESGLAELRLLPGGPVRLDRHPAPCGGRFHLDVQFAAAAARVAPRASAESHAVAWFDPGALPADTDDSVRRLVEQARQRVLAGHHH